MDKFKQDISEFSFEALWTIFKNFIYEVGGFLIVDQGYDMEENRIAWGIHLGFLEAIAYVLVIIIIILRLIYKYIQKKMRDPLAKYAGGWLRYDLERYNDRMGSRPSYDIIILYDVSPDLHAWRIESKLFDREEKTEFRLQRYCKKYKVRFIPRYS